MGWNWHGDNFIVLWRLKTWGVQTPCFFREVHTTVAVPPYFLLHFREVHTTVSVPPYFLLHFWGVHTTTVVPPYFDTKKLGGTHSLYS